MRYIDKEKRQLIIDTPVHKSTTKTIAKNGKVKENVKYIAHIPNDILIFLLEKFRIFNALAENDAEYINAMISGKDKFYLSFYNHPGKDAVELTASNEKHTNDNTASVTIQKQITAKSYFFTLSKKLFNELKDDKDVDYVFRFILPLKDNEYYFKNFVIDVMLV